MNLDGAQLYGYDALAGTCSGLGVGMVQGIGLGTGMKSYEETKVRRGTVQGIGREG